MPISDLLLPEFDAEMATTRRVLERTPDGPGQGEWKPHAKSFPLAHLAQLIARLPGWVAMTLEKTELDLNPPDGKRNAPPYSVEKTSTLLAEFDKNVAAGRAAIAKTSDADFDVPWTLKSGGKAMLTQSRYMILRSMMLNHVVHHRAQLGLYLRMLDQKVPQMYGPTADDKM